MTGMEYVDAENIAVSVLRVSLAHVDPDTMQPHSDEYIARVADDLAAFDNRSSSLSAEEARQIEEERVRRRASTARTVTYFLNTVTMQVREGVAWATEVPQAVQSQGQLCPEQRRMPQVR